MTVDDLAMARTKMVEARLHEISVVDALKAGADFFGASAEFLRGKDSAIDDYKKLIDCTFDREKGPEGADYMQFYCTVAAEILEMYPDDDFQKGTDALSLANACRVLQLWHPIAKGGELYAALGDGIMAGVTLRIGHTFDVTAKCRTVNRACARCC